MNVEAGAATEIEAFLSTHAGALDAQQLRVYRSRLSGRDRIGVIYGEFTTREQASAAISQLPATVRATYPYVPCHAEGNACLLSTGLAQAVLGYRPAAHGHYVDEALVW